MIEFFLPCIPPKATHHSKRIVRVGRFHRMADSPALNDAKDMLDALLVAYRPHAPLTGPVALSLEFTWPWPTSATKKLRALGRTFKATKPDCSNLAKTIEDRLVALRFMEDDAKVCVLTVSKFVGDDAGISVRLQQV